MPSIAHELACTPTARWYRAARSAQQAEAWADRARCFAAFDVILVGHRTPQIPGQRWMQQPVRLTGVLAQVQAQAGFVALETVYKRWRAPQAKQTPARWAGPNPAIKPGPAFVTEAKIVAFWPYRQGCLQVADDFDMSLTEITGAYLRTLAAWASAVPVLAACEPAGAPGCASEDFTVIARRLDRETSDPVDCGAVARRLEELACHLIGHVLADASLTPLGAFNTIRDDVLQLLAKPQDPLLDRVLNALAELGDQLSRPSRSTPAVSDDQAQQLLLAMSGISALLASGTSGPITGSPSSRFGEEGDL